MERRPKKMSSSFRSVLVLLYTFFMTDTVIMNCPPGFNGPTCKKQNVALNRSTDQISTYTEAGFTFASQLAVDGNTDVNTNILAGRTCSVTNTENPSWWYVLLDKGYNITQMTIYLRGGNGERYGNMTVFVDDNVCKHIQITREENSAPSPNPVFMMGCDQPRRGNNISITVDSEYLTLCEVQVWVCSDGWFGDDCTVSCHCINGMICDKVTGYCRSGCARGWQGDGCQTECEDQFFGNCSQKCNCQKAGEVCDKTNGACASGCKHGTYEPDCQTVCSNKTYGDNCSLKCGQCKDGVQCDIVTGVCSGGCEAGFMLGKCDEECRDGMYGENCTHICGRCSDNTACNKVNGSCSDGCQHGFSLPLCKDQVISDAPDSRYDPVGGITGGVVAAVLALIAVGLGTMFYLRRKGQLKRKQDETHPEEVYVTINDDTGNTYDTLEVDCNGANTYTSLSRNEDLKNYIRDKLSKDGFDNEFKMVHHGGMEYVNTDQSLVVHSEITSANSGENVMPLSVLNKGCLYTTAQDPTDVTENDFWKTIWEQKVKRIVMLTAAAETEQFWPEENRMKNYGDIVIQTTLITVRANYSIRKFKMTYKSTRRQVTQFHFTNWTQHSSPPIPSIVSFLKLTRVHRDGSDQVLVHSRSRGGHIGVFITLDSLMTQIERKYDIDMFQSIAELMQTPEYCLTSAGQYKYAHEVLLETLESYGTFYTLAEFDQKYGTGLTYTPQQEEELRQQFEALCRMNKELTQDVVSDGLLPENQAKNRYHSILPANQSRPLLPNSVTGMNDYINAVVLPSHTNPASFLVTQTPLENTVIDFWRLVYHHNCDTIVCFDDTQDALLLYPRVNTSIGVGNFLIETVKKIGQFETNTQLDLEISQKGQSDSSIRVLLYQVQKVEIASRDLLSSIMDVVSQITSADPQNERKILIHCHDGCYGCGLFCSVMNIVSRLRLDKEVDIFLTIRELQSIRPQFVQSFVEYKFCYDVVKEYTRNANIYINESV